jgi:hypothetical protein
MGTKAVRVSTLIPAPRTHKFILCAETWKGENDSWRKTKVQKRGLYGWQEAVRRSAKRSPGQCLEDRLAEASCFALGMALVPSPGQFYRSLAGHQ